MRTINKYIKFIIPLLLTFVGSISATAEDVIYYIGGSGEGHYASFGEAVTAAHTTGDTDVTFMLYDDVTENAVIILQSGDNFTIKSPEGERHSIEFSRLANVESSAYQLIKVIDATLNIGGDDSGVVILRAWSGSTAMTASESKVLVKVENNSVLNIYNNAELAYGYHIIWMSRGNISYPLPVVNMYGGVIHSGTGAFVSVCEGTFNMYGGSICGHYFSEGTTIPYDTGASGKNRLLTYQNVVDHYSSYTILPNLPISDYINSVYGESSPGQLGLLLSSSNAIFNMSGGQICGISRTELLGYHAYTTNTNKRTSLPSCGVAVSIIGGVMNFSGGKIFCCHGSSAASLIPGQIGLQAKDFDKKSITENYDHCILNMSGDASITYCTSSSSTVRIEVGSTFNMNGGTISKCNGWSPIEACSAGVRNVNSKFIMKGNAVISYCGVYEIKEQTAGCAIGAVYAPDYGKLPTIVQLEGGEICHNYSAGYGAGVAGTDKGYSGGYLQLTLKGTKIHDNEAGLYGGGIYVGGSADFIISGGGSGGYSEIYNNVATGKDGGGVYLSSASGIPGSLIASNCKIYNNSCGGTGGGICTTYAPVTLNDGTEVYNNNINGSGAGIYLGTQSSFTQNGGKIYSNTTQNSGAGVYVSDGTVTINGGEITGNTAKLSGGGIYAAKGNVTIQNATIGKTGAGNTAQTGNGGAIYVAAGNLSVTKSKIAGNAATAQDGGAFYVANGIVTLNGANKFNSNEVGRNGAGIYVNSGTLTMDDGEFSGNTAQNNGGGFYVSGGNVKIFGGNIEGNNAKSGAGAYVTGGTLSVIDDTEHGTHTAKTINGNTATENGGGFYVNGGDVKLSNASITANHAASGAGLYSNGGKVTFTSGAVGSNIATGNGGGMYVNGGSIDFAANLEGNKAANGGGLFLASGADMTFFGGVISRNRAIASESASATTAYHGGSGIVQGCGGGIYLQKGPSSSDKTTLSFDFSGSTTKTFGLYSNEADKAGAEIVSEGGNTQVQLPAISEMQLVGFEGQDASPYWYQDYFTEDTGYGNTDGHAVAGNVTTVDRFKNIMKLVGTQYLEHRIPETRLPQIMSNYLCVTMSFSMLNITLKATGLLGHETAMFKLIRHGTDENTRYDILLRADDGASKTLRNMPWGTYSVIPNNSWNYAYDPLESKENIRVGETDHYLVEYKMNHKNAAAMPQHDERQIQGKSVPSSTIEGEKPEKYNGSEL